MQVHNLTQGTDQWRAHRSKYLNASDAPAMMACSPNVSRTDLVRQLALGIERDFSDYVQRRILDKGHLFEKLARPMAEKIMGEELAPLVGTSGKYGASYDGQTMLGERSWEHKRLNAALREAMFEGCTGADLPLCYQVQMEHQAMVAEDTQQILFTASEWDDDGNIIEVRHCWYTPNPVLRNQIIAGWAQLEADVAAYVAPEPAAVVNVTAKLRDALPALVFEAKGEVTACNVDKFKVAVLERINTVNMELVSDQDFADGDADAKWLRDVSIGMKSAVQRVRSGMVSVNEVLTVLEQLDDLATKKAIAVEKLVKARKEEIRGEIVASGIAAFRDHMAALNTRLGKPYMPQVHIDFAGAIKGKRTVDSLRSAVNDELARAKLATNEIADCIQVNLTTLRELASQHAFLFADTATIVLKAPEDLTTLAKARIAEHDAKEAARLEAERERIRREEQERADREAREKLQQQERDAQAAIAQAAQQNQIAQPVAADLSALVTERNAEAVAAIDASQVISTAQRTAAATPTVDTESATLLIGGINRRLGYDVNALFLKQLGFEPARIDGARRFYRDSDLPLIGRAIAQHTLLVTQLQPA